MGKIKKKKIRFELLLYYPEDMDNNSILESFDRQVIDEASSISSDDIETIEIDESTTAPLLSASEAS